MTTPELIIITARFVNLSRRVKFEPPEKFRIFGRKSNLNSTNRWLKFQYTPSQIFARALPPPRGWDQMHCVPAPGEIFWLIDTLSPTVPIGIRDGWCRHPKIGKIFFGQISCKIRGFINFSCIYFRAKMFCCQSWLSSYTPMTVPHGCHQQLMSGCCNCRLVMSDVMRCCQAWSECSFWSARQPIRLHRSLSLSTAKQNVLVVQCTIYGATKYRIGPTGTLCRLQGFGLGLELMLRLGLGLVSPMCSMRYFVAPQCTLYTSCLVGSVNRGLL